MWGIHQSPVNSSHKGQWCGALMFPLICAWINGCANNRNAGDLRCHRTHYDVTINFLIFSTTSKHHKTWSIKIVLCTWNRNYNNTHHLAVQNILPYKCLLWLLTPIITFQERNVERQMRSKPFSIMSWVVGTIGLPPLIMESTTLSHLSHLYGWLDHRVQDVEFKMMQNDYQKR